jgi:hypothetical protein
MDNVQKVEDFINIPSSQTFRSYFCPTLLQENEAPAFAYCIKNMGNEGNKVVI